uniref:WAP domain-containing protein n=1 Tax=Oryza glumipatula TaxID=40148 RepID=A0A0E0BIT9_9ORYZ
MAKCMTHTHQGVMLFFLVLLVCSAIPAQIRGQNTNKIGSDMPTGVKSRNGFPGLDYKPDHCVQTRGGFYCCSLDQLCYPTLEGCIPNCTPPKLVTGGGQQKQTELEQGCDGEDDTGGSDELEVTTGGRLQRGNKNTKTS